MVLHRLIDTLSPSCPRRSFLRALGGLALALAVALPAAAQPPRAQPNVPLDAKPLLASMLRAEWWRSHPSSLPPTPPAARPAARASVSYSVEVVGGTGQQKHTVGTSQSRQRGAAANANQSTVVRPGETVTIVIHVR
jgi:hypothetical protein